MVKMQAGAPGGTMGNLWLRKKAAQCETELKAGGRRFWYLVHLDPAMLEATLGFVISMSQFPASTNPSLFELGFYYWQLTVSWLVIFLNKCSLNLNFIFSHWGCYIQHQQSGPSFSAILCMRSRAQALSEPWPSQLWNEFPLVTSEEWSHGTTMCAHYLAISYIWALDTSSPRLEMVLFSSLLFNSYFCFKILFRHQLCWEALSELGIAGSLYLPEPSAGALISLSQQFTCLSPRLRQAWISHLLPLANFMVGVPSCVWTNEWKTQ